VTFLDSIWFIYFPLQSLQKSWHSDPVWICLSSSCCFLCCEFLWIVQLLLSLQCSLTFIYLDWLWSQDLLTPLGHLVSIWVNQTDNVTLMDTKLKLYITTLCNSKYILMFSDVSWQYLIYLFSIAIFTKILTRGILSQSGFL
jgi:hypothetical protein